MATKIRIEFDNEGFQKLLNLPEVKKLVERTGERIANAAGEGFEAESFTASFGGSPRPAVTVRTETHAARKAQAEDNALETALYAGR